MKSVFSNCGKEIFVSEEDFEFAVSVKWNIQIHGYARLYRKQDIEKIKTDNSYNLLHRIILPPHSGLVVDHINRNKLDNRRENLRLVTRQMNALNSEKVQSKTSKYKGVSLIKRTGAWRASICINNQTKHIGIYEKEIDAAIARDKAYFEAFGSIAFLNFPDKINS